MAEKKPNLSEEFKRRAEVTHQIMLLSRLLEEGVAKALEMSFNDDRKFLEQVKDCSKEEVKQKIKNLEIEFYSIKFV